ncbi:histidinol-phosphate transaminase [Propionibacteriaceae bacterium Y2011]|uniref:histidinol-phosphate transaminase n=1 Tax=Microlunatus sp. Y2014 TaxID=3418488 RepID=UPI003B479BB7
MVLPLRPDLRSLPAYVPGKPAPVGPDGVSYKLSSNENPYPPLPSVLDAVAQASTQLNRYPDAGNVAITEAVAESLGVSGDRLAFGAGSVGVLYHLLQATCLPGDEVVYAWRSFEAYPIAVQLTGATPVPVPLGPGATHDLTAMAAAVTNRTKVVLLCTPNNPTGPAISHDSLINFLDQVPPTVIVVVDEAYVEFVDDPAAARGPAALEGRPNVVVLRTFSKAYGLAGFRVGFCLADPTVATAVRAAALPFGVSVVAQAAVLASLAAKDELMERVGTLVAERATLLTGLRELGFDVPDSQANFVWLPAGERTRDWAATFDRHGLMTRPYVAGNEFDGVRITVGEPAANELVLRVAAELDR